MARHQLVAGPGQLIAAVPISLDLRAAEINTGYLGNPEGITDGLVGWWIYESITPGQYTGPPVGECPFCFSPLQHTDKRPGGRAAYRIRDAVTEPGSVEFMLDVLPDTMDLVGCAVCAVAFTRPFVEETPNAVAPR